MVNRILNRHIKLEDIPGIVHAFDDFSDEHWSYAAFMESIYTHDYERKPGGIFEEWTKILADGLTAAYNQ